MLLPSPKFFSFHCEDPLDFVALTQLPRAAPEPRPAGCGRAAVRQLEYNCSRGEASHWPDHMSIYSDSASRVRSLSTSMVLALNFATQSVPEAARKEQNRGASAPGGIRRQVPLTKHYMIQPIFM